MTENTETLTDGSTGLFRPWTQEITERKDDQEQDVRAVKPTPAFEEHSILPSGLHEDAQPNLLSVPLVEVDKSYGQQETFIVLNRSKRIFRFSASNALKLFSPISPIRRTAISIATHPAFALFIIAAVLVNCWCLSAGIRNISRVPLELIFLSIYAIELIVKVLARGLVNHEFAYLRDAWNWLDLIILIAGIWSAFGGCGLGCIPLLGEFRILKIGANAFGLRKCIHNILISLKGFRGIYLSIVYVICVVALIWLHLFQGRLTQACVRDPVSVVKKPESLTNELWTSLAYDKNRVYHQLNGEIQRCGNATGTGDCPSGFVCLQGVAPNPNNGYTSFDTFGWSILSTVRLISREYWEDLLYNVVKTTGPFSIIPISIVLIWSYIFASYIWAFFAFAYLTGIKRIGQQHDDEIEPEKVDEKEVEAESKGVPTESRWQQYQQKLRALVNHRFFILLIVACIILNTIFLALDHHDMPAYLEQILKTGNWIFFAIYIFEAILKIAALGPLAYLCDKWNCFELLIVVLSILEVGFEGVQGLSILRAVRLLRPFRLGRVWPTFNLLLTRMGNLATIVLNHVIILLLVIFVFVVFGTKYYGSAYVDNKYRFEDNEVPRWSFVDVFHSFMVVFRTICGEWIESMWDCLLVGDATCIAYFLLLVVIGNLIFIHLFLALLVSGKDAESLIPPEVQKTAITNNQNPKSIETQLVQDDVEAGSIDGAVTLPLGIEEPRDLDKEPSTCFPERCYGILPLFICCDEQTQLKNVREKLRRLLKRNIYQTVIVIVLLIANLALTVIDTKDGDNLQSTLNYIELIFIVVLAFDGLIKLTAHGLKAYITNVFHLVDLLNVAIAVAILLFDANRWQFLLALRPLSLILRSESIIIVITAIASQLSAVLQVIIASAFLWLIFAILGVQLFAGKFYKCVDNEGNTLSYQTINDSNACKQQNYTLVNSAVNFDNLGSALFSLLEVASFKGWILQIQNAVDSREIDRQPIREANIYTFFYFVLFIVCGVFCVFNLIIGAIVAHINRTGHIAENYMTRWQIVASKSRLIEPEPKASEIPAGLGPFRTRIFTLINSKRFELVALGVLLCNCLLFTLYHYGASADFQNLLNYLDIIFILLLAVEIGLRIFALGIQYIKSVWNVVDILVLVYCIFEWCFHEYLSSRLYFYLSVILRVVRIGRYEHYIISNVSWPKTSVKVTHLFSYACWNILFTILAVEVIYAFLGVRLFHNIKPNDSLNDVVNFNSFIRSMLLLTQLSNGAGWDGVADAITNEHDCYTSDSLTNCGSNIWGTIYIVSYIVISFILLINFHLCIILELLSHTDLKSTIGLSANEIEDINKVWANYDAESSQFIPKDKLSHFLDDLSLDSIRKPKPNEDAIKCLRIPENDNHLLAYNDVINALVIWKVE